MRRKTRSRPPAELSSSAQPSTPTVRLAELPQRGQRVGLLPAERPPPVLWQRLGQHEPAVGQVHQRQRAGHVERQVQVDGAQQPAHGRPHDEADAEHRAQQAEALDFQTAQVNNNQ